MCTLYVDPKLILRLEAFRLQPNLQFKLQHSTFFNGHLFTLQETIMLKSYQEYRTVSCKFGEVYSSTNGKKIRTSKVLDLEPNLPDPSPI
jgi:hypothetical protein